jgi:hypothetical protein
MKTLDTKTLLAIQDLHTNGHLTTDQALQLIKSLTNV